VLWVKHRVSDNASIGNDLDAFPLYFHGGYSTFVNEPITWPNVSWRNIPITLIAWGKSTHPVIVRINDALAKRSGRLAEGGAGARTTFQIRMNLLLQ
jgi:hypothetical protein